MLFRSSANLTTPGTTIYTLTATNAGGSGNCSATVNVGCARYRVWNATGARRDFSAPNGTCVRVNNGNEITGGSQLSPGLTIIRYTTNNGTCGGAAQGTINYTQAMAADMAGNGDCRVDYRFNDTVTDR